MSITGELLQAERDSLHSTVQIGQSILVHAYAMALASAMLSYAQTVDCHYWMDGQWQAYTDVRVSS